MVTFCQVCRAEIPPERVAKKARTCGDECQKQYRTQMRSERAGHKCRLCGRTFRKSRNHADVPTDTQQATGGRVLHEHTRVTEVVEA